MVRFRPYASMPWPLRWATWMLTGLVVVALGFTGVMVWTVRQSFPQLEGTLEVDGLLGDATIYRDGYGVPHIYADTSEDLFLAQGYVHAQDRFWQMDFRRRVTAGRLSELFGPATLAQDKVVRTLGWRRVAEQELGMLSAPTRRYLGAYAKGVNGWMEQRKGTAGMSLEYSVLRSRSLSLTNRRYEPEPWTPVDSLAWLKAIAWDLRSNMPDELGRAIAATSLTRERVDQLWPAYPYDRHQPIVTEGAVKEGHFDQRAVPLQVALPASRPQETVTTSALTRAAAAVGSVPTMIGSAGSAVGSNSIGSNSWMIGGELTVKGKPLLANDPHLAPSVPSVWYQAGLHCRDRKAKCPFDVSGFTFAGVPGVTIGHNNRISWGVTNLGPDVTDLYLEKVEGSMYEFEGGQKPLITRTEKIEVATGDPVTLTVTGTGNGPIISDVVSGTKDALGGGGANAVALKWTALEPGRTADAFFALNTAQQLMPAGAVTPDDENRTNLAVCAPCLVSAPAPCRTVQDYAGGPALPCTVQENAGRRRAPKGANPANQAVCGRFSSQNWDDFREAARLFDVPAQNLIYADIDGNIGYQTPGKIPVRAKGDGTWPVPGWSGEYVWRGTIPFEQLPSVHNPEAGYIVTANNAVIDPTRYVPMLTKDWAYGHRSQRVLELVQAAVNAGKVDVETMSRIQQDTHNTFARTLVPVLLGVEVAGEASRARELLRDWDYSQGRDSAAAAYFNAVWRHLLIEAFNDELAEGARPGGGDRWFEVVRALLERPTDPFWDNVTTPGTEGRDDILRAAMTAGYDELAARLGGDPARWRWGDVHSLTLRNGTFGTSGIALVEWLFNRGPFPVGGSEDAVNANSWNAQVGYAVSWVPSMRMIVDLADLDESRWVDLTGASGHAFHDNYDDQSPLWASDQTTPMLAREASVKAAAVHMLTLTPRRRS